MKLLRLFTLLSCLLISACASLSPSVESSHFSQADQDALATVHVWKNEATGGLCSLVVVAPEHALTAAHCVDLMSVKGAYVLVNGKKYIPITYKTANDKSDHAMLYVPDLPCPCAPVAKYHPLPGDSVIAIGYPYGLHKVLTRGEYQGHAKLPLDPFDPTVTEESYMVMTSAVLPGNSGGGDFVMIDNVWYLVGITSRGQGVVLLSSDVTNYKAEFKD